MESKNKRIYVQYKNIETGSPCSHGTIKDSKYWLEADYARKYNNCVFCAIEMWGGSMPHEEIALCLDVSRIKICQIEKKAIDKIKRKSKIDSELISFPP